MTDTRERIRAALDHAVERPEERGDWERVLADAQRRDRAGLALRAAAAAAAALALAAGALLAPFEDDRPVGVIDRALAAIGGDGPVVHLVTRGGWGGHLVDLETGEVTPLHGEQEVWYDPARGAHSVARLGGQVTSDTVVPAARVARQAEKYVELAAGYRTALATGRASVAGPGRVGDREVLWIRVRQRWTADYRDGRRHLLADEVAVDRETYEPVYMRWTRDGRPWSGADELIVELETLPAGEGDFTVDEAAPSSPRVLSGFARGRKLTRAALAGQFDGRALWLGHRHDGMPLSEANVAEFRSRDTDDAEWEVVEGVSLFYGWLRPRRGGIRIRDDSQPYVQVLEAAQLPEGWHWHRYVDFVPEGKLLVAANGVGFLKRDGLFVSLTSPNLEDMLEAALALRRVGAPRPDPGIDVRQVARLTGRTRPVTVEGGRPVRPRPLVLRRGRRVATATARGARVEVFAAGIARFDTRGIDRALQRQLPKTLQARCYRIDGDRAGSGAGGPISKSGVRDVVMLGQPQRGRIPVVRGPFDACDIGAGVGRNWLPRFDWHGPFELPLTREGRRFFEERAAALELAHFVRTGARRRARRAMRNGTSAPPAGSLRDPARPYIRVSSDGDRFRASLTAPTGRRFFIEIVRGGIGRKNVGLPLAFVR